MEVDLGNTDQYFIVNKLTGETGEFSELFSESAGKGWNITYPRVVSEVLVKTGGSPVLAWMLLNKDTNNLVIASARKISEMSEMSISTVERTLKLLKEQEIIRKVQNGVYMLNPKLLCWGGKTFQINQRKWEDLA